MLLNNIILLSALYDKKLDLVYKLLENKDVQKNLSYSNEKGETAFLLCLHFEYHDLALKILDYDNIGLEKIDKLKNNSLVFALKKQYEDVGLKILEKNFRNINYVDEHGDNALTCALRYNQDKIIEKLFTYPNLDVNIVDSQGDSPLIIAIDSLKESFAMAMLMKYKVNIDYIQRKHKFNALNLAICKQLSTVANYLVDIGADTSFVSNTGDTALFCAISNNMIILANKISRTTNPNCAVINNFQDIALGHAINTCDEKLCLEIYNKDISSVETINQDNDSTLILALTNNMYEIASLLIKNSSDDFLKHINNNQDNALFLCITNGFFDLAKILIEKKCYDINHLNGENDCLLFFLINNGAEDLVLKVFNDNINEINVNIYNNEGNTLLVLSIINGMTKLSLQIISKMNIDYLNKINIFGDNALLLCVNLQYWEIIRTLITIKGIDLNIINKNNDNALLLMINLKQWDLVELLLQNTNVDKFHRNRLDAYEILKDWRITHLLHYFEN
tara:strand:+ start:1568 stop:3085 length:1518 start_codon:yes stop_codon:yes gene_type:complete